MTIHIAKATLQLYEDAVKRDQGATFRQLEGKVLPHISDAYRGPEGSRSHMGASGIGNECARAIWYSFRWTSKSEFTGRTLRLFNRGHLEEGRFIALLLAAGLQVFQQDENGKQYRISAYGGHFGGSGDGVGIGFPELPPGAPALLEFKTHNDASFKKLKKEGVRASKFEHYVQMQVYMIEMNLAYAMYHAVNKNDDELYVETVVRDETGPQFISRGVSIVQMREAPKRVSNSPGWVACLWCDHKPVCHLKFAPQQNCRTCTHSVPVQDGTWMCENPCRVDNPILSVQTQKQGCTLYERNKSI